jgi:hypothetical protein
MIQERLRSTWCGWAVALISLLWAQVLPVYAGETVCYPDKPTHCARPLTEGETAPFSGQLLTTELSLDLGLKADFCDQRIKLELKFQKKTLDLELDLERRLHELDRQAAKTKEDLLLKRLEEATGAPWYEHPAFVATVSVIVTVLVFIGARETLKKLD